MAVPNPHDTSLASLFHLPSDASNQKGLLLKANTFLFEPPCISNGVSQPCRAPHLKVPRKVLFFFLLSFLFFLFHLVKHLANEAKPTQSTKPPSLKPINYFKRFDGLVGPHLLTKSKRIAAPIFSLSLLKFTFGIVESLILNIFMFEPRLQYFE